MKEIISHVVVVDNGSNDETKSILSSVTPNSNSTFEVIFYSSNRGTTLTRNAGLKLLQQYEIDFYCILDSDTIVNEDCFNILSTEMALHKEYGLIGPQMVTSKGLVQISARSFPTVMEKICKGIPVKSIQKIGEQIGRAHV